MFTGCRINFAARSQKKKKKKQRKVEIQDSGLRVLATPGISPPMA